MKDRPTDLFDQPSSELQRRKKAASAPVFKEYTPNAQLLLPPSLEDLLPADHIVRVVDRVINDMRVDRLLRHQYRGGGASAYDPKMMAKVIVYSYISKVYSCRQIARALRQDVSFMWLAGMNRPDFRTINLVRSGRLKSVIDDVFTAMVIYLHDHQYIKYEHYFVDGTKIAADANRHKVIWKKNTKRHKERLQQKIKEHLKYIDELNEQENAEYGDHDLEELGEGTTMTSEDIQRQAEKLKKIVEKTLNPKKTARAVKKLEKTFLPKLQHYEHQERLLGSRNSYSRTDPDATVFLTLTGELLPMYTVMFGTENQYIVNYTIHQKASETDQFIAHMTQATRRMGRFPRAIIGDAAYGSEENYAFLDHHGVANYLKYNTFDMTRRPQHFDKERFSYDGQTDSYRCPEGRTLSFQQLHSYQTPTGYHSQARVYQSNDCTGCSLSAQCKRGEGKRTVRVNARLERYRQQARSNLESEQGITLRRQRYTDVEPTFGDIKWNAGYRRFRLRGKEKIDVETGLLSIAHNIKKIAMTVH
jgi:transposase